MAEPLNATFFAFRKREPGGVLIKATIAYVVISLAIGMAFLALNWSGFVDYFTWAMTMNTQAGAYDPNNPASVPMPPASVMALIPTYFIVMFLTYLLLAAYEAACLKWLIHGETGGFFGLSLGADTWRVWAGYWMWLLLLIALYVVCAIVMVVFMGSMFAAGGGASADPSAFMGVFLGVALFGLALAIVAVYFGVRFAPAAATSIARRRFSFFSAWTVTKGRFWPLLGSFALLYLMAFVGYMVVYGVAVFAILGSFMNQAAATGGEPTQDQVVQMFASPGVWIPLVIIYLGFIIAAFVWMIAVFGVNARAVRAALEEGKIAPAA